MYMIIAVTWFHMHFWSNICLKKKKRIIYKIDLGSLGKEKETIYFNPQIPLSCRNIVKVIVAFSIFFCVDFFLCSLRQTVLCWWMSLVFYLWQISPKVLFERCKIVFMCKILAFHEYFIMAMCVPASSGLRCYTFSGLLRDSILIIFAVI